MMSKENVFLILIECRIANKFSNQSGLVILIRLNRPPVNVQYACLHNICCI
jgi:hypothetical protein